MMYLPINLSRGEESCSAEGDPTLWDLEACSARKFLNLESRKSYSSFFPGTFLVNQYAGKCNFPAPEISLAKDWLNQ